MSPYRCGVWVTFSWNCSLGGGGGLTWSPPLVKLVQQDMFFFLLIQESLFFTQNLRCLPASLELQIHKHVQFFLSPMFSFLPGNHECSCTSYIDVDFIKRL